jgi:hypothetical protein
VDDLAVADLEPERFAALVAPAISRVHANMQDRTRAEGGRDLVRRHAVPHVPLLVTLRFVLPRGPLERAAFPLAARYDPPDGVLAAVDELVAGGWLQPTDGGLVPDPRVLDFLNEIYDLHARVTGAVWPTDLRWPADVAWLADTTNALLGAAADTGGPAFTVFAPPHERPGDPPGLLLFNRLAALRYHRSDAHAAAWSARGLSAGEVQALPAGSALLQEIEADTNRGAAPPFAALPTTDRLTFLAGLAALR